jgi:thiosulfate/3-mercaptopyruvate sulfurtransferase
MAGESFDEPRQYLVETDGLAAHLDDPDLRVLDCTVFLHPTPDKGLRAESGRAHYDEGHVPGAAYAGLIEDLSDRDHDLRFMLPPAGQFAEAMSRYGVGDDSRVVLYDAAYHSWSARIWWMLRAFGFDDAAVLNGGWRKWRAESRPVSTEPATYPPASFTARPRSGLFVDKEVVQAAIGAGEVCTINALTEEQHRGSGGVHYGRPGRIAGSVNVPARGLIDPETFAFKPLDELRQAFESVAAFDPERVIVYCGGGIAASSDAFVLTMLGAEDVAVYDASLSEWVADPDLPMETG